MFYLLLSIVAGQPVLTPYNNQADACVAYAQQQTGAKIYEVETGRKVDISEGECKPVPVFQKK